MVLVTISRLDPYPSDLSDKQWEFLGKEFPELLDIEGGRRLLEGVLYKYTTGIRWTSIPRDFPNILDLESFCNINMGNGFLDKILTYLGSHYTLPVSLVSRFRARGLELNFKSIKPYEVEYDSGRRLR